MSYYRYEKHLFSYLREIELENSLRRELVDRQIAEETIRRSRIDAAIEL